MSTLKKCIPNSVFKQNRGKTTMPEKRVATSSKGKDCLATRYVNVLSLPQSNNAPTTDFDMPPPFKQH